MVVWENGIKKRPRKYYMTMFLREAYSIYQSSVADSSVSFSKFGSLCPKNVLLLKDTPKDQCKCKIHENFILMLDATNIKYDKDWLSKMLCDDNFESICWKGECSLCKNGNFLSINCDMSDKVIWKEWIKDPETERLQTVSFEGCYSELLDNIVIGLPELQEHVRVKWIQSASFEYDKSNFRVLQVDFAMAYSCEYQNEVQSAL